MRTVDLINKMLVRKSLSVFILLFLNFLFAPFFIFAQDNSVFTLTAENLKTGTLLDTSKANWKYHAGDDAKFAAADINDN